MKHKKLIAFLLIGTLAANGIAPAFADKVPGAATALPKSFSTATTSGITGITANGTGTAYMVQYSQVEQMILNQNLQVQSNHFSLFPQCGQNSAA